LNQFSWILLCIYNLSFLITCVSGGTGNLKKDLKYHVTCYSKHGVRLLKWS